MHILPSHPIFYKPSGRSKIGYRKIRNPHDATAIHKTAADSAIP